MKISLAFLGLLLFAVFVLPALASLDSFSTDADISLHSPTVEHPLGTDLFGRDNFSRFLYGGRTTILIATLASGFAGIVGLMVAFLPFLLGEWSENLVLILISGLLAIPGLMIAFIMITILGQGVWQVALAVGLAQVAPTAQICRSARLQVQTGEYVLASRAMGASSMRVAIFHLLPNMLPTFLSYFGLVLSYSIFNGAALSFLGIGVPVGTPDWGVLLAEGRSVFAQAPLMSIVPGLAISCTVLALNSLFDKLATLT